MNIRMLHNPAVIKVEAAFFLALIKVYYWKPAMVLHNDRCRHLFISPISSVVAPHIYLFQERLDMLNQATVQYVLDYVASYEVPPTRNNVRWDLPDSVQSESNCILAQWLHISHEAPLFS